MWRKAAESLSAINEIAHDLSRQCIMWEYSFVSLNSISSVDYCCHGVLLVHLGQASHRCCHQDLIVYQSSMLHFDWLWPPIEPTFTFRELFAKLHENMTSKTATNKNTIFLRRFVGNSDCFPTVSYIAGLVKSRRLTYLQAI